MVDKCGELWMAALDKRPNGVSLRRLPRRLHPFSRAASEIEAQPIWMGRSGDRLSRSLAASNRTSVLELAEYALKHHASFARQRRMPSTQAALQPHVQHSAGPGV